MAVLLSTDPVVFARDENNDLIIPLRKAFGLEAVMILVRTALLLWRDEYFLNRSIGMPWLETEDGAVTEQDAILGQQYDPAKAARAIRRTILGTPNEPGVPGVDDVVEIKTAFDNTERGLSISCVVKTRFGDAPLTLLVPA